jgi:serine/threonine protein phosphatase PrpC
LELNRYRAMPHFETVQLTKAYRNHCEDRVAVIQQDDRTIIVVADGAGGVGNGDLAAEAVLREVTTGHQGISTAEQWEAKLREIDCRIGVGESTAVIVDLRADAILGASVGDSRAWIICGGELVDLTAKQTRKPLLGSGEAHPTQFSSGPLAGTLIVATDGFCNYVKRDHLTRLVAQAEFIELPRRCVELVRLPSGELWDDIGIVACRVALRRRTRNRYNI